MKFMKLFAFIMFILLSVFSFWQNTLLDEIYKNEKDNIITNKPSNTGSIIQVNESNIIITQPIKNTITFLSQIAVALWVTLIIVWWIRMIIYSNDEGKISSQRKNIIWIILGLILVLSATSIIVFLESLINYFIKNAG